MQLFNDRGARFAALGLSALCGAALLVGCNNGGAAGSGSGDTLATVGDAKVTRSDLVNFLEAQSGEQVLPYLIDTRLIFGALKAKNLDVTDAEVQADLARRQENDATVAQLIAAGGSKLDVVKEQIKRDLAVQKLLTADVKVNDAALKKFFAQNAVYYDQPAKVKVGLLFASTKTRADLMASQLAKKSKTFEALVEEQKNAKDPIAGQSTADRGTLETLDNFSPAIGVQLQKLANGATTPPQQIQIGLPQPVYIIFRRNEFQPAKKADLTALRPEAEMDYKLAQVAQKTVGQNPKNPPFSETLRRTQAYIRSQNPAGVAPRLRDVLNFINQTAGQTLVASLRPGGNVQIDDPLYSTVAQQYQGAAPGTGNATGAATANSASAPAANAASSAAPAKR